MTRRRRGDNARSDDALGVKSMGLAVGLAVFDRQPLALKLAMWESPLNLGLTDVVHKDQVEEVVAELHSLERLSTIKIWGRSHPQATGPRFKPLRHVSRESRLRTLATGSLRR